MMLWYDGGAGCFGVESHFASVATLIFPLIIKESGNTTTNRSKGDKDTDYLMAASDFRMQNTKKNKKKQCGVD
jgi:hypothetical protein